MYYLKYLIFVHCIFMSCFVCRANENPKVVVIGAGIGGLTTAYRLHQKGIDVHLYEARGRVGGRILTAIIDETVKELGGQNINDGGEAENLKALIEEFDLDLVTDTFELQHSYFDGENFVSLNKLIQKHNFNPEELKVRLEELEETCQNMSEVLKELFDEEDPIFKALAVKLCAYEGGTIEKLSPMYATETLYNMLIGGWSVSHPGNAEVDVVQATQMRIQGGNTLLTENMATSLGERLHLDHALIKISKLRNGAFSLKFKNGKKVKADIIVLAIPCSVYDTIDFKNTIPQERLKQIKSVQYGLNAKIVLPLKEGFENRTVVINDRTISFMQNDFKLFGMYFANAEGVFTPKTIGAAYKREWPMIKQLLGNHCPEFKTPQYARDENYAEYSGPVGYSWGFDPYAKGSYTFVASGQEKMFTQLTEHLGETIKNLFAPIDNKIYFAGEHATILLENGGTMEGACESGERAARMILRSIEEGKNG